MLPSGCPVVSNLNSRLINLTCLDAQDSTADVLKPSLAAAGWQLTEDDRSLVTVISMAFTQGSQKLTITIAKAKSGSGSDVVMQFEGGDNPIYGPHLGCQLQ